MDTITIIGGGFAGVQAARAARRSHPSAHVQLIDDSGDATMIPSLPDLFSGRLNDEALSRPLGEVAGDEFTYVRGRVHEIDLDKRVVSGVKMQADFEPVYDVLVIATGSVPSQRPAALRSAPAFTVHSLEAARALREELAARLSTAEELNVVIAGAGYTGIETAVAIRDGVPDRDRLKITLVDAATDILPMLSESERQRVHGYLRERSIDLKLSTLVDRASSREVLLGDGTRFHNALLIWSAGMVGAAPRLSVEVEATRDGRIITNEYLQLPSHPEVFIGGDLAAIKKRDALTRRAVNIAHYSGRRAGQNAARMLQGRRLRTFTPVDLGWVIPLGGTSSGKIFGVIRVRGNLGLRLHYIMCGFRHFGGGRASHFYKTAFRLSQSTQNLVPERKRSA
ncbi:MAG: NAD(P)/FAD-dependent oxidoreductase [Spirochaetota bacterium]